MAPCTAMSLTQWFTRSAPTVWCSPSSKAIFSLVPTPSAELTRMGFFQRCDIQPVERAEAADAAQHIAVKGLLRQVLDAFLGAVATADVHAGVGVGHGFGFGFVRHGAAFCGWICETALLAGKINFSRI